jgi:hypothetical protein
MNTIESFVIELLNDIKSAAIKNENFDLHMEATYVREIAEEIDKVKWIEIY